MSGTTVGCAVIVWDATQSTPAIVLNAGLVTDDPTEPTVLSPLVIRWGRSSTIDQIEPASLTFPVYDPSGTEAFRNLLRVGRQIYVSAGVLVYWGRITDVVGAWNDDVGGMVFDVTAQDRLAELANRDVGAEPWPMETLASRLVRLSSIIGIPNIIAGASVAGMQITRQDVDRQTALSLLTDLAASVDSALYDSGPLYPAGGSLEIVSPADREAAYELLKVAGVIDIHPKTGITTTSLDVCWPDRAPLTWRQSVDDVTTGITVTWLDQTGAPAPTERRFALISTALEDPELPYGARRISLGTMLTSEADASVIGNQIMARLGDPGWIMDGVTWQFRDSPDDAGTTITAYELLRLNGRFGLPVRLEGLPADMPLQNFYGYVEGGTYVWDGVGDEANWTLQIALSAAQAVGQSAKYLDVDSSWLYSEVAPAIEYSDLYGVDA